MVTQLTDLLMQKDYAPSISPDLAVFATGTDGGIFLTRRAEEDGWFGGRAH